MSEVKGKAYGVVASKDYETALAESAENAYIYFPTDRNTVVFNARNMGGEGGAGRIDGQVSLAGADAAQTLNTLAGGLETNGMAFYLIADSSGNLPSLKGETHYTVHPDVALLLNGSTDDVAVNVGDLLVVARLKKLLVPVNVFRVIPLNDAKPQSASSPGVMGLESPWDKAQIDKIPGIVNQLAALKNSLPTRSETNMNNALDTGVYPWCTLGRPSGSTGAYTCLSFRSTSVDGNGLYSTLQFAFGRQGELGKVYTRMIFYEPDGDGSNDLYLDWSEITGGGSNVIKAGLFTSQSEVNAYVMENRTPGYYEIAYDIQPSYPDDEKYVANKGTLYLHVYTHDNDTIQELAGYVSYIQDRIYLDRNLAYRELYRRAGADWVTKFEYGLYDSAIRHYIETQYKNISKDEFVLLLYTTLCTPDFIYGTTVNIENECTVRIDPVKNNTDDNVINKLIVQGPLVPYVYEGMNLLTVDTTAPNTTWELGYYGEQDEQFRPVIHVNRISVDDVVGPFIFAELNTWLNDNILESSVGDYTVKIADTVNGVAYTSRMYVKINTQEKDVTQMVEGHFQLVNNTFLYHANYRMGMRTNKLKWSIVYDFITWPSIFNRLFAKYDVANSSISFFTNLNFSWKCNNTDLSTVEYRPFFSAVGLLTIQNYNAAGYKRQRVTGPVTSISATEMTADKEAPIVTWERRNDYVYADGNAIWYKASETFITVVETEDEAFDNLSAKIDELYDKPGVYTIHYFWKFYDDKYDEHYIKVVTTHTEEESVYTQTIEGNIFPDLNGDFHYNWMSERKMIRCKQVFDDGEIVDTLSPVSWVPTNGVLDLTGIVYSFENFNAATFNMIHPLFYYKDMGFEPIHTCNSGGDTYKLTLLSATQYTARFILEKMEVGDSEGALTRTYIDISGDTRDTSAFSKTIRYEKIGGATVSGDTLVIS